MQGGKWSGTISPFPDMLRVTKRCYQEMIGDATVKVPNEACGILSGAADAATAFHPMANTEQSPVSYLMDPKEQFQVMKQIRLRGERMLAVYHSHVASQAHPSAKDVSFAFYPEVHYVIVSLTDRKCPSVKAFRIEEGKVREEPIQIV